MKDSLKRFITFLLTLYIMATSAVDLSASAQETGGGDGNGSEVEKPGNNHAPKDIMPGGYPGVYIDPKTGKITVTMERDVEFPVKNESPKNPTERPHPVDEQYAEDDLPNSNGHDHFNDFDPFHWDRPHPGEVDPREPPKRPEPLHTVRPNSEVIRIKHQQWKGYEQQSLIPRMQALYQRFHQQANLKWSHLSENTIVVGLDTLEGDKAVANMARATHRELIEEAMQEVDLENLWNPEQIFHDVFQNPLSLLRDPLKQSLAAAYAPLGAKVEEAIRVNDEYLVLELTEAVDLHLLTIEAVADLIEDPNLHASMLATRELFESMRTKLATLRSGLAGILRSYDFERTLHEGLAEIDAAAESAVFNTLIRAALYNQQVVAGKITPYNQPYSPALLQEQIRSSQEALSQGDYLRAATAAAIAKYLTDGFVDRDAITAPGIAGETVLALGSLGVNTIGGLARAIGVQSLRVVLSKVGIPLAKIHHARMAKALQSGVLVDTLPRLGPYTQAIALKMAISGEKQASAGFATVVAELGPETVEAFVKKRPVLLSLRGFRAVQKDQITPEELTQASTWTKLAKAALPGKQTAGAVDSYWKYAKGIRPYAPNQIVETIELKETKIFYRVFGDNSDKMGPWLMEVDPRTLSKSVVRDLYSLPPNNSMTFMVEVRVPTSTVLRKGIVDKVDEFGTPGGGIQWELIDEPLESSVEAWSEPIIW